MNFVQQTEGLSGKQHLVWNLSSWSKHTKLHCYDVYTNHRIRSTATTLWSNARNPDTPWWSLATGTSKALHITTHVLPLHSCVIAVRFSQEAWWPAPLSLSPQVKVLTKKSTTTACWSLKRTQQVFWAQSSPTVPCTKWTSFKCIQAPPTAIDFYQSNIFSENVWFSICFRLQNTSVDIFINF